MTIGGFTEWAHLRLRDHRPGPMSYAAPAGSSQQRSILMRFPSRLPEAGVGPGEYEIPTTINQCRSTVFGPPLPADSDARDNVMMVKRKTGLRKSRGPPPPLPKQYSLALSPDTPAFTMYGKSKEKAADYDVGPGDYVISSMFDKPSKGPSMGKRTKLLSSRDVVPGPATYNIPRFGDEKPKRTEYITSIRRIHKEEIGPGPGAYDDPTTIAARFASPERCLYDGPRFGARYKASSDNLAVGPGPAAYGDVSRIMTAKPTHTPIFHPPMQTSSTFKKVMERASHGPSIADYTLPSDFDCDYSKGPTFGMRVTCERKPAVSDAIGPGAYDLGKPPMTTKGFRFASRPHDLFAISSKHSPRNAGQKVDTPGPGAYFADLSAVRPSRYKAVAGFGIGKRFSEQVGGGPLCYNVRPPEPHCSTVFYRGDYSRSKHLKKSGESAPSLYNVDNDTIADSVRQKKGFTFGIRYPARATHQVCKPYDETTNTNCQYDDETTWMVKIK